jgi:ADP-heptose:LPS heptosyltransferase
VQWRALLDAIGPKMKVGIAWTGGKKNTGKHRRSLDLDDLLPILRQDATFVSLQYMDSPDILALQDTHGITIHHWRHAVQTADYDDTAALVAELDLVICVTTAALHLCGAMGQRCWVMMPKHPHWMFGISGDSMPWYESVKLYRQKHNWVELIAEVATDLRNLIRPKPIDLSAVTIT